MPTITDPFEENLSRGVRSLARRDPIIRVLAKEHGLPRFRPHGDYFDSLVYAIISQQISGKAATSIRAKLRETLGGFYDPRLILELPDEVIRGAGISPQKLGYLRSLSEHVLDGRLDLEHLASQEDGAIIAALTDIRGMGLWTAQMFLIFTLGRLDILPTNDLGVQKGIQRSLALEELPKPRDVERVAEERRWSPYRSIASWYMWRATE